MKRLGSALLIIWALALLSQPLVATASDGLELYQGKHGVYYQIFVHSFADGDGDGVGDLRGIVQRLDYLVDLGVTGIWLTPIHPSPTYHKYDVTDYYAIDPEYGTLEDFRVLLEQAHARGIKVLMDLVLNHTSSQHPWFLAAKDDPASPYRDYYIWAGPTTQVTRRGPWNQQVWHQTGDSYYYGLFWGEMPSLNWANPDVRKEFKAVAEFWLNEGVDGFRLDAAKHLFEHDPTQRAVDWWLEFSEHVRSLKPDVYLVGEVWDSPHVVAPYYAAFDSAFNFDLASKIIPVVRFGLDTGLVTAVLDSYARYNQYAQGWAIDAPFLSNHDQDRVMSQLFGDWNQAKVAAAILLTLPGNPFIYAGEEIGMQGKGSDESRREPFKWYAEQGPGQTSWQPSLFNTGSWQPAVESQRDDPASLLNHYRSLIHLRLQEPALKLGEMLAVEHGANPRVITYGRSWQGERVLVMHNISRQEQEVLLGGEWGPGGILFASGPYRVTETQEGWLVALAPYTTLIWK